MDRHEDRWYQNCLSIRIDKQPATISFSKSRNPI
jgi:hypothetical protein